MQDFDKDYTVLGRSVFRLGEDVRDMVRKVEGTITAIHLKHDVKLDGRDAKVSVRFEYTVQPKVASYNTIRSKEANLRIPISDMEGNEYYVLPSELPGHDED